MEYDECRIFRNMAFISVRDAASMLEIVHDGASDDGLEPASCFRSRD